MRDAHVAVILPAYRRRAQTRVTVESWVNAWMQLPQREAPSGPSRLSLVVVDDDADGPDPVDAEHLAQVARGCQGDAARDYLEILLVRVFHPEGPRSFSSIRPLNHAAALTRAGVLVLSNAESFVLSGQEPLAYRGLGREEQGATAFCPDACLAPAGVRAPAGPDSDPRLHYGWREQAQRHADVEFAPFRAIADVSNHGGYLVGSAVNTSPAWTRAHPQPAFTHVADVPARHMQNADDLAWRSHPVYRPTDLHWASVIRADDFWELGGFSDAWVQSPTGWGEDGEFSWRVRLWCEGHFDGRVRPFQTSTTLCVVHQWHPPAIGGAVGASNLAAFGESLYDRERMRAWRKAARPASSMDDGRRNRARWADAAQAFADARVETCSFAKLFAPGIFRAGTIPA